MRPEDMFAEPRGVPYPPETVKVIWPQARGELSAFANVLERRGAGITAEQLRLAIHLADEAYEKRNNG
jgi:hypothetical protein